MTDPENNPERVRLQEDQARAKNWKRWGPYLSERQWATVREDYSANGNAWAYFPHDHARSRVYRWGEDGLLGITDRECRLCFAVALWNGKDSILKERLFGLTAEEGNHGEDVKECYYYLDSTPTHSYLKALYKYPQRAFPYMELLAANRARGRDKPEYELTDTGAFSENRYFDVFVEYAKAGPNDIHIRITAINRAAEPSPLTILPTLWFRNTWTWDCDHEGCTRPPNIRADDSTYLETEHETLERMLLYYDETAEVIFTDNHSNFQLLYGAKTDSAHDKDAFHRYIVDKDSQAVNADRSGTKAAPVYRLELGPGASHTVFLRLVSARERPLNRAAPKEIFQRRQAEADLFFNSIIRTTLPQGLQVARQAAAGLLWSKQFYHYIVSDWLQGDPSQPIPPPERAAGRNHDWPHIYTKDILSMPDKWEYPWFAAWDVAFHMLPLADLDPALAKHQLLLLLREWYMHPNGQLPAYEFAFSDVNPPVHAWAAWRVYKIAGARGDRDIPFLESVFHKLLINFTWWVNRKDAEGNHIFAGGFLGLDNIGVFDRSRPLPSGGYLQQADGTAWMAFYCLTMLSIALELAKTNPVYQDMASKFFEHFVAICDSMNSLGGFGLWDEPDGFYYDQLKLDGKSIPLKTRSLVGILPLIAVEVLEEENLERLPAFKKRMDWFLTHRPDLASLITFAETRGHRHRLLAVPTIDRLCSVLRYLLDENEFLSPFGIRSLSKVYGKNPYVFHLNKQEYRVVYAPGEGTSDLFGGNSNWRGPVWFPINYLVIEALERYHHFFDTTLEVECPTGSGRKMSLKQVARELAGRLIRLFLPDKDGHRPCDGGNELYASDSNWKDLVLFHEYFHGETGRGCGASHQTGWTALVFRLINSIEQDEIT